MTGYFLCWRIAIGHVLWSSHQYVCCGNRHKASIVFLVPDPMSWKQAIFSIAEVIVLGVCFPLCPSKTGLVKSDASSKPFASAGSFSLASEGMSSRSFGSSGRRTFLALHALDLSVSTSC